MARILQVRRGTTAQNNNFTGMPGEVTFDTETKTLRVHDGQTLGGFILARTGTELSTDGNSCNTPTVQEFDITSVPDEFWQSLFNRMSPHTNSYVEGNTLPIGPVAYIEQVFNISSPALFAHAILICSNADAGYSAGDEVMSFGIGSHNVQNPNIFRTSDGVHVRLFINGGNFWVSNKTTGVQTNVSYANWRIKFRVYY